MNLLQELFNALNLYFNEEQDDIEIPHEYDKSGYTVVDGEEGDHGTIKYLSPEGKVIAIRTVEGGDVEWIDFTSYGIEYMTTFVEAVCQKRLQRLKNESSMENVIDNAMTITDDYCALHAELGLKYDDDDNENDERLKQLEWNPTDQFIKFLNLGKELRKRAEVIQSNMQNMGVMEYKCKSGVTAKLGHGTVKLSR